MVAPPCINNAYPVKPQNMGRAIFATLQDAATLLYTAPLKRGIKRLSPVLGIGDIPHSYSGVHSAVCVVSS